MTDTAHNTNTCGYGEQLVGYLYGEANAAERRDFERHLEACSACHDELAAFGFVRVAVGEWRQAVRQQAPALALADSLILKGESALPAPARPARDWRHAVSSLREFFTLSPVWMQAGTVAAALVVCALAALAVARVEVRRDVGGIAISFGAGQSIQPQQRKVAAPSEP
ncbi:MAG: anti-sigma factor family protein, partial [Pyrinomonadaceae bacterium]